MRELPYAQSVGYEGFGQLIKEVSGIYESDDEPQARDKIHEALGQLGMTDPEESQLLSVFVGAGGGPAPGRSAMFDAARRWVEALGRQQPTLLVFEDIHWAHPSALDLIESLAARTKETPVVLLALARPELLDLRPGWGGGLTASTTIRLDGLSAEDAHLLATGWMSDLSDDQVRRWRPSPRGTPCSSRRCLCGRARRVPTWPCSPPRSKR